MYSTTPAIELYSPRPHLSRLETNCLQKIIPIGVGNDFYFELFLKTFSGLNHVYPSYSMSDYFVSDDQSKLYSVGAFSIRSTHDL